jgi:hypothetical protein
MRRGRGIAEDWANFTRGAQKAFSSPQDFVNIVGNELTNSDSKFRRDVLPVVKQVAAAANVPLPFGGRRKARKGACKGGRKAHKRR